MARLLRSPRDASDQPLAGRDKGTVFLHRVIRIFLHLVAWIFLVLVVIGSVSNHPVVRDTYFLKVNLANIIPVSVPDSNLINSIARTIGLHDFYQVGMWNFCEGYDSTGITDCSPSHGLYYFNPVRIILNELLAGATIALPADISDALAIARVASYWMSGLFMTAAVLSFVLIFVIPFAVSSRPPQSISPDPQVNRSTPIHRRRTFILLRALPFLIIVFFNTAFTVVASIIATVMFSIFRNVFLSRADLNIKASLGGRMLAFMWIASAFNLLAFIFQFASFCAACCGGRRARKQLKEAATLRDNGPPREKSPPRNANESTTNSSDIRV